MSVSIGVISDSENGSTNGISITWREQFIGYYASELDFQNLFTIFTHLTVANNENVMLSLGRFDYDPTSDISRTYIERYKWAKGSGEFSPVGAVVIGDDIIFESEYLVYTLSDANLANTVIRNLGNLPDGYPFTDAINYNNIGVDFSDVTKTYLVQFFQEGFAHLYIFKGVASSNGYGLYGVDLLQCVIGDFNPFQNSSDMPVSEEYLTIEDAVSASTAGIVNNLPLQELGGTDKLINSVRIGRGKSNIVTNTVTGNFAGNAFTTANNCAAFGTASQTANLTGNACSSFGAYSMYVATSAANCSAFGNFALQNTNASNNTGFGYGAGAGNTSGIRNTYVGSGVAITASTSSNNTMMGAAAGQNNTTGHTNVFMGWQAGANASTATKCILIGTQPIAGTGVTTGQNDIIVGRLDTGIQSGSGCSIFGNVTGLSPTLTNTVIIANGVGTIAFQSSSTNEVTLPNQTIALISGGSSKAAVTKEYLNSVIPYKSKHGKESVNPAASSVFVFPHGLGQEPLALKVDFNKQNEAALRDYTMEADNTNITITFTGLAVTTQLTIWWSVYAPNP